MRSLLLVPALLVAAACGEKAAPEEMMPEAPPAPAMLTAENLAGTWTGMTMMDGSDSVVARWTATATSDTTGVVVYEGTTDSIAYTTMLDADSMVVTSMPYVDATREDGMMVMFRSVGRLQADGSLAGTSQTMVVGSPDVVGTNRWTATKAPM